MKKIIPSLLLVLSFSFPLLVSSGISQADEMKTPIVKKKSHQTILEKVGKHEVLLENNQVLMVRLTYAPGSESGFHEHQYDYRTIYVIKGGQLSLINDDETQTSKVITIQDGQALYVPGSRHNIKNIGNTEVVLIETELK